MSTNSKLQSAIRHALNVSAGASALALSLAPNAFAQDTDADEDKQELPRLEIEETVVTGSRIKRADIDSASPVSILDRDEILAAGVPDVGEMLQRMPSMSGSPIGTTTNNGGNGSVQIDLRGMGANRTLTLVNGRRVVDGGDYQTIPADMIERVEILKDGASAVYGADAVAGVVNIITRRDFEGIELSYQRADWFDAKGAQDTVGLITGTEFAGGNFVFGAEFVKQEEAFQKDVPWDFMQNSYYIYPEGCENQVAAPYDGTPSGGCYPIGSSRIPQSRLGFVSQGTFLIGEPNTTPYGVGLMVPHDGRTYNYAPVNYIQTPYERTNIFAEAHFDLTQNVRFNAEIRGNFRESEQFLAPLPYNSPTDPAYFGNWNGTPYRGISEQNFYLRKAVDLYNATNGTSLAYEPIRDARRRMIETNRTFEQEVTQYQWTAGLEGECNDISWEVFINEGHRSRVDQDFGQFSGDALGKAMGPSADLDGDGQPECYEDINDPDSLIAGCVPINFFGGGEVNPDGTPTVTTLTQDMIDYVSLNTTDNFRTRQRMAGIGLTGNNFELPGGEIGWAVGWTYWRQEYKNILDSAKTIGAVTGNVGASTFGHLTNNSFYAEVLLPFYDNGDQSIILKGGYRYDDWDAFSGDDTYQLGLEVNVLEDLKLRGTYGKVFRAPTITEVFGGQVDSFPTYSDPCIPPAGEALPPGCAQVGVQLDSQLLARVGGNVNLKPEKGDTLTAGVVWTPSWGEHGLSVTVDYWEIKLDDAISSLGAQFILDDCYINNNPASCSLITRGSQYEVALLIDGSLNVAKQGGKGVDTEIRWDYSSSFGQWEAAFLWAHLLERTKTAFPGAPEQDLSGRYTDPTAQDGGAYAEDKINMSLQWLWNDFSIGWLGEYISGLDADTFCNCGDGNRPDGTYIQDIDSQFYHDIVASYTFEAFGSTTTLSGGITNVTDEAPPYIEVGFNATTDPPTYRMFGRGWYLRLAWEF